MRKKNFSLKNKNKEIKENGLDVQIFLFTMIPINMKKTGAEHNFAKCQSMPFNI